MKPDFWHERWRQNQIGFHQDEINPYLRQFWPVIGVAPGSRVFVPLCGKSRDMLWLHAQGSEVVGVEVSPLAVEAFFGENGLQASVTTQGAFHVYEANGVHLYCGDFFDLTAAGLAGVSAVYDRASLVALPPEMRSAYAERLLGLLAPGTKILLVAFDYPQHEMNGPPFSVGEREVLALYGERCDVRLLCEADILERETRFRDKGVSRLNEVVYELVARQEPIKPFRCRRVAARKKIPAST